MLFIRSYDDLTSRRDVKPLPKHSAKNLSLLQPLDAPRRLTAELVARLTADITSGKLAPGSRLPTEQEMIAATGVSRTVIREAVAALRADRLVITRQGVGAFVASQVRRPFRVDFDEQSPFGEVLNVMLVTIIGPGVFAGIIAIALRSIGFCAKLLYEAIEEIDESQVEAVRSTGASGAQVTSYGIVPQVLPAFAGISVFRWDINIRESTVLGLVGAGGIGLELNAALTQLYWTQVSLILLVIIATVIVSEWVSAKIRHAII